MSPDHVVGIVRSNQSVVFRNGFEPLSRTVRGKKKKPSDLFAVAVLGVEPSREGHEPSLIPDLPQ
jgi:hypothetical protein